MKSKKSKKRSAKRKAQHSHDVNANNIASHEDESLNALTAPAEPWEKWESQLVIYSLVLAIIGLIILGILINLFIL